MGYLTRSDGLREMRRMMDQMDSLWDRLFQPAERLLGDVEYGHMALDVSSNDKEVIVRAELPGVKEEDIHLSVERGLLTLSAETRAEREDKGETYHMREMRYGKLARAVQLPVEVNVDKAEAVLEDGVLTVKLPRTKETTAKQIAVKARKLISGKNA